MKRLSYIFLLCLLPLISWAQAGTNEYLFQGDDTVSVSGMIKFYDNGGQHGRYTNAAMGAVTFVPSVQGEVIKMVFNSINTKYNDYFIVLNGNIDGTQVASYSGTTLTGANLPLPIVSTAPNGALTVKFQNITGTVFNGWDIEIHSIVPRPLAITSVQTTAISTAKVLKGSQNQQMLKIELTVEGEKDTLNISKFAFSVAGTTDVADIQNASVYSTDTISIFSTNNRYATSTGTNLALEGETEIVKAGVYKFWLTYDIASTATVGNSVQAQLDSIIDMVATNTPASTEVAIRPIESGFSGNYTIGQSPTAHYQSFADAIAAMANGIDGEVVFTIEAGTYSDIVLIPHIEGASAINTITFKSSNNNYNEVVIERNNYGHPAGYPTSTKFGIFNIHGADYITISGLTFKTTSKQFESVIMIQNISRHVTIENCRVEAPRAYSYSDGTSLIRSKALNVAHSNNDYLTIRNCYLDGTRIGLYIDGTGYVRLPKQRGALIEGNVLHNQGFMGIYLTREHDGIIRNNHINVSGSVANGMKPIDVSLMGNTTVANNRIYADNTTSSYIYALYMRRGNDEELQQGRNRIYNNEIILDHVGGTSASYAIECSDPLINTDIVYNSVNIMNNNGLFGAALHMAGNKATQGIVIANNLFQNNAGAFIYALNRADYLQGMSFNNNAYYTSTPERIASVSSDTIGTLADWQTRSGETNAIEEQAQFLSTTSLDLTAVGNLAVAEPLSYVTTDINNTPRSTTTPTIGAYEFATTVLMPIFEENYPSIGDITFNSAKAKVKVTENGKVFYMAKLSTEAAPTTDEIVVSDSLNLSKNVETEISIAPLNSMSEYIVYFMLKGMDGGLGDIVASSPFTTLTAPTQVSTFEEVTVTAGDFIDGTAVFSGFTVETITDGVGANNVKAAKLTATNDTATIVINNNPNGLVLTGFYLKSEVATSIIARNGADSIGYRAMGATDGKWIFIDLKSFGQMTGIDLIGTGNIFIDNFSGEPQPISFTIADTTADEGNAVIFNSDISGGVPPYTYAWTNAMRDTLSTTDELNIEAEKTCYVYLTVTDAWGNRQKGKAVLTVIGSGKVATFDDLYLAPESYWWGDTVITYRNTFFSGSYSFANTLMPDWNTWGLFAYSNKTSTSYNPSNFLTDQFNSAVGHGANNSANYAVVYASNMMGHTITKVTHNPDGDTISGCYITNNAWVKYVSLNGTGLNSTGQQDANTPFGTGDWYKLTATADNGKKIDFYLADYRDENNTANHYTLDTWQWLDLRSLGAVKSITFTVDGSRKGNGGLNIPAYFCLDELGGERNVSHTYTIKTIKDVATMFDLDTIFPAVTSNGADVVYTITDSIDSNFATIAISDNKISVLASVIGERSMVVSRTIKGETMFAVITLEVEEEQTVSLIGTSTERITLYPNPATERFSINADGVVEIFATNGQKVYVNSHYNAGSVINVSAFARGAYMVKINGKTLRLIVK